ncbi:hypothetical protein [Alteromonas gracilis]|uniref:hypothetical protein n=1 Tax=Alteromonas gracilis TaxID=1479524 RepID=UPI0030D58B74
MSGLVSFWQRCTAISTAYSLLPKCSAPPFTLYFYEGTRRGTHSAAFLLSCILVVLGLAVSPSAKSANHANHANAAPLLNLPDDIYQQEREQFIALEKKLRTYSRRRISDLDRDIHSLAEYPLYPYLLRLQIERSMSLKNKRHVRQFLQDYA